MSGDFLSVATLLFAVIGVLATLFGIYVLVRSVILESARCIKRDPFHWEKSANLFQPGAADLATENAKLKADLAFAINNMKAGAKKKLEKAGKKPPEAKNNLTRIDGIV